VDKLIKQFNKDGHQVIVLTFDDYDIEEVLNENIEVYRIKASDYKLPQNFVFKVYKKLSSFLNYPFYNKKLTKKIVKMSREIIDKYEIQTIVSTYLPPETFRATHKLNRDVCKVAYILDSLWEHEKKGKFLSKIKKYSKEKWEKKILRTFNQIIIMNSHKDNSLSKKANVYISDIPLIENNPKIFIDSNKNWIFSGTLYYGMRSPEYAIKIFNKLRLSNTEFHFFTKGDYENYLVKMMESSDHIRAHGYINKNEVDIIQENAGILISIGNKNSNMVPSKIFELMSMKKKIIHFYNDMADSASIYLNNYPKALCINENEDFETNIEKIRNFIESDYNNINWTNIFNLYKLNHPKYTTDLIVEKYLYYKKNYIRKD
jgi:hypothetical protein